MFIADQPLTTSARFDERLIINLNLVLNALDQKIETLPDLNNLRTLHQKWRLLKDRDQVLCQLIDQVEGKAGVRFIRPKQNVTLHSDDEIDAYVETWRFRSGVNWEVRRSELKKQLANVQTSFETAADRLGLPALQSEIDRTEEATEAVLDQIWEIPVGSFEDVAVYLDVAMGEHELAADCGMDEEGEQPGEASIYGRLLRALMRTAPGFDFPSLSRILSIDTAAAILAIDDGTGGEREVEVLAAE
ncbi:MAG TPA: hypothetical protein VHY35_07255 [Stellaceae bacterium]|jgi:hypothetical protein|nr:hypothetical protein [Stellaceae bacterium]